MAYLGRLSLWAPYDIYEKAKEVKIVPHMGNVAHSGNGKYSLYVLSRVATRVEKFNLCISNR